jgi:very-short-patch-repair endonuclease
VGESAEQRIAVVAARQHGVFTAAQATDAGFTVKQRSGRVTSGRWELLHPGVYTIAGAPSSWRGQLLASCWAAPGLAAASHRAGARLRDLPGGVELVEITCKRWKRAKFDGLIVHEMKGLDLSDIEYVDQIPTTTVEHTLMGLAAILPDTVVEMAIDRALYKKMTTITRLEQFLARKGKRGRNGAGILRELVRNLDPLAGVPESAMETKLKQLLRRHGLPMPQFQYEIRDNGRFVARVDAAYPEHRIAIEFDSYEHHTGKRAIDRDSERRARLSRIRWETITFTAAALRQNGGAALETLRSRLGFGAFRS